ncbi:hypothetical protein [Celeribacter sp.]
MLKYFLRKKQKEQDRVNEKVRAQQDELDVNIARLKEIAAKKREAQGA